MNLDIHTDREAPYYAASYVALQNGQADQALQMLGALGDVRLIDLVSGAWTNADYGKAAASILDAVYDPVQRYRKGKNLKYLPDPGAFCLLDAIDLLMEDNEARFYPRHPAFMYKRIGAPTKPVEGYPRFVYEENPACAFSGLVWNEDRLNLSIRATYKGTIDLSQSSANAEWQTLGLPNPYPCVQYRNYTLIKDGILNVTSLPVSMSFGTYHTLTLNGMIAGEVFPEGDYQANQGWAEGRTFIVDFTAVPLINLRIASENLMAKDLCERMAVVYRAGAYLKVAKAMRERLDPDHEIQKDTSLTPEQESFLEGVGVKRGVFSPPVEKGETTDVYLAKEFKITGKGFSSLPSVKDVEGKLLDNKRLTPAQESIANALDWYHENRPSSTEDAVSWLDGKIDDYRRAVSFARSAVQRAKFGIILNKKWFPDLGNTRDGAQLEVDGITFTFNIKDVEVAY